MVINFIRAGAVLIHLKGSVKQVSFLSRQGVICVIVFSGQNQFIFGVGVQVVIAVDVNHELLVRRIRSVNLAVTLVAEFFVFLFNHGVVLSDFGCQNSTCVKQKCLSVC